jgi:hypothetical protein
VLGVTGGLYVIGLFQLSEECGREERFGKVCVVLLLAIFGGLAWYLYSGELLSKPLASITVGELIGISSSFMILAALGMICIRALLEDD